MTTYSVAEARNNLSKLIERAERGETITVTRHGKVAALIISASSEERPLDDNWKAELLKLADNAIPLSDPKFDTAAFIRGMRDEGY